MFLQNNQTVKLLWTLHCG